MNPGIRSQSAYANSARRAAAPGTPGANDASHKRSQSAWENMRGPGLGRSNTTRTPRKNGFDPATPGADEPSAAGTAGYFTTQRREPQPSPLSGEVPLSSSKSRASPNGDHSPGRGPFGRRSAEDIKFSSRIRTPYHSTPGERTYVTSESIRRSASTRDTTYHQNAKSGAHVDPQTPEPRQARHRSASPSPRSPMPENGARAQPPRFNSGGRNSSGSSSKQATSSSHSPDFDLGSSTDESDDDESDDDDDYVDIDEFTSTDETEPSRGGFARKSAGDAKLNPKTAADKTNRPKAVPSSIWKMRDGRKPSEKVTIEQSRATSMDESVESTVDASKKFKFSPTEWDGAFASGSDVFAKPPNIWKSGTAQRSSTSRPGAGRRRSSSQSAVPSQRRNQSNIGKKTSTHESGRNGTAPSASASSSSTQQPSVSLPNGQAFSSSASTPSNVAFSARPDLAAKPNLAPLSGEAEFSAAKWAQTLKEPHWVFPPQKPSSPEKRPKPVRFKSGGNRFASVPASKQASVSDVADESGSSGPSGGGSRIVEGDEGQVHKETGATATGIVDAEVDDENAMDIDLEPDMRPPPVPVSSASQSTRPLMAETEIPLQHNRHFTSTAFPDSASSSSSASPRASQRQTRSTTRSQPSVRPSYPSSNPRYSTNANNISDTTTNNGPTTMPGLDQQPNGFSLRDFKHVAPFYHASNTGLSDLDPVAQTLPFDSRPSTSNPLKQTSPLLQLHHLPPTPRAPSPPVSLPSLSCKPNSTSTSTSTDPSTLPPNPHTDTDTNTTTTTTPTRLTKKRWSTYLTDMQNYLVAWNAFNRTMLSHFAARQSAIDHQMQAGWLGAAGEPSEKARMGFEGYVRALREDEMVRAHWNGGCERHREVLERHGRLREMVRRGGVLVG